MLSYEISDDVQRHQALRFNHTDIIGQTELNHFHTCNVPLKFSPSKTVCINTSDVSEWALNSL